MKRSILLLLATTLTTWADVGPALGQDAKSPYTVSVTATGIRAELQTDVDDAQRHPHTLIRAVISRQPRRAGAEPEVISRPTVLVEDGQRAQMMIGQTKPAVTRRADDRAVQGDLFSGIRIDIIKPREQVNAIVVTTIWENGSIAWAQTDAIKVIKDEAKENATAK